MLRQNLTPASRAIYEKVVSPVMKANPTGGAGIVLSYNYITKLATVEMPDPVTGTKVVYSNVPVEEHGRGVKLTALKPGTEVWVQFNSPTSLTITTIFSEKKEKEDQRVYSGPQVPRYLGYIGG